MSNLLPSIPGLSALSGLSGVVGSGGGGGPSPPVVNTGFVSVWNTARTIGSETNNKQIKLPLRPDGTYDFVVDWGDGQSDTVTSNSDACTTHTYVNSGIYTVTINGTITGWGFRNAGDKTKILAIESWGNLAFTALDRGVFNGCSLLKHINSTDAPDLSLVTNSYRFFNACSQLGASGATVNLSGWNTSNIANAEAMFMGATSLVEATGLNTWDVSNVTRFRDMFSGCSNINTEACKLDEWDVSSAENMRGMFFSCSDMIGTAVEGWDVSSCRFFTNMFYGASSLDADFSAWNVNKGETFNDMFRDCASMNSNFNTWAMDGNASQTRNMFYGCSSLNSDFTGSGWQNHSIIYMDNMFRGCSSLDRSFAGFKMNGVQWISNMWLGCNLSTANYDATLIDFNTQGVGGSIFTAQHFGTSQYTANSAASVARNTIINSTSWTISDGGPA